ncbi:unnamed protein product [Alopecurus aequalis]
MQSLNCVSFLLGAAIVLATHGPFVTVAHRELLMETNSEKGPETRQELTAEKTSIDVGIGNNVVTRRKMALGGAEAKDDRSIPSSGAKHPVGKCAHGGRKDLSTNCYFRSGKLHPGAYFDGHIPFTADYPKTKYHQPKNN